jgi:hypothetical protein
MVSPNISMTISDIMGSKQSTWNQMEVLFTGTSQFYALSKTISKHLTLHPDAD